MPSKFGEPWTKAEVAALAKRYPNEVTEDVARAVGRSVGATYAKAKQLGVRKSATFLNSPASGRVSGCRTHAHWTSKDLKVFRDRYPNEKTEVIARDLNRTVAACYGRAKKEGLRKSEAFLFSPDAGRCDGTIGQGSRFRRGHVPVNKGQKGWCAGGRSVETQFQPGAVPKNFCPVGSYRRTTKERFWILKVQDEGLQRERWIPLHKLIWIEHHGPIPPKHVVRFIDGNVDNVTIENLELLSFRENMLRNTVHKLPKDLVETIRAKGVLTRTINTHRRLANEEQIGRPTQSSI